MSADMPTPIATKSEEAGKKVPLIIDCCIVFLLVVLPVLVLIFALTDLGVQSNKYTRTRLLALDENLNTESLDDDDDGLAEFAKDTPTVYTAAYLFSGPLNLPAYFFAGLLLSFVVTRAYDTSRYYADFRRADGVLIFISGLVAWIYLLFNWICTEHMRSLWNSVNGLIVEFGPDNDDDDDLPDGVDIKEEDVKYIAFWGSSPFTSRGSYLYIALMIMFLGISVQILFTVFLSIIDTYKRGRESRNFGAGNFATALRVLGVLMVLPAIVIVIFFFVVIVGETNGTKFWACFHETPYWSIAFFYIGWIAYLVVTNQWWLRPSVTRVKGSTTWARGIAIFAFVFTVLLGLTAAVFAGFQIYSGCFEQCWTDPASESSDLKEGVCKCIREEREATLALSQVRDTDTVCDVYCVFSWWLGIFIFTMNVGVLIVGIWYCANNSYEYDMLTNEYTDVSSTDKRFFSTSGTNYYTESQSEEEQQRELKQSALQNAFKQKLLAASAASRKHKKK